MRVNTRYKFHRRNIFWWSLCPSYLLACQGRLTAGDSGLSCDRVTSSANRRFLEITGEDNLIVFSYSGRVKSPEWRWQRRRADLRHFEIFKHGPVIIYTRLPAGGTYYPICTFPASSECLIGISDAFSAFCLRVSVIFPTCSLYPNKSMPTQRYTFLHCCFTSTEARWLIRDGDRVGRGRQSEGSTAETVRKKRRDQRGPPPEQWKCSIVLAVSPRHCPATCALRNYCFNCCAWTESQRQCPLHCC